MTAPTFHIVNAIPPIADIEEGGMLTDIISARGGGVLFIYYTGVNAGADSAITVQACSTITATATTAIPFVYRSCVATDVWGDWAEATSNTFTTSQVSNAMHQIWVDPAEIAETGYEFVRMVGTEDTDTTCLGGVLAIVLEPRYGPTTETFLT